MNSTPPDPSARLLRRMHWGHVLERDRLEQGRKDALAEEKKAVSEKWEAHVRAKTLEHEARQLRTQLAQRDEKIRRLQASTSWKLTAPLRALRRSLLDRFQKDLKPTAETAKPGPEATAPTWSIDLPHRWEAAPAVGLMSGWACWPETGLLPTALRAFIDGEEIQAKLRIARKDVTDALKLDASLFLNCGFELRYRLEPDCDHEVRLEAQTETGAWFPFHQATLHTSSAPVQVKDYEAWVEAFGRCTPERAAALRSRLAALPETDRRLISVLMPVYNAPEKWLARAIESVREQVYENWELCIADDASTAPHVKPLLERYASLDPRIRIVFRTTNGHISHASNSALEIVRGEFTALLDHDDEIPRDALAEVVLSLAANPETDILYSDEDKIDEQGRRYIPYFKPDYLPDLLTGQNCFSHLSVLRSSLMREIGGFRAGYEGSQDWDLCLRAVEKTTAARIRHIPKVLYHWRAISGSTAVDVSEKSYSTDAARRALLDHHERQGLKVEARPVPGSHWRIVFPLPTPAPKVSILIPTRNGTALLRRCIASLISVTDYPDYEIIVVNNQSDEPEALDFLAQLRREPGVSVIDYAEPFNYSAINNFAVQHASGELLCLLNNDIEVISPDWLGEMVSQALRPRIGAVGAMLYYPDYSIQHAGVILGLGGVANHAFTNEPKGSAGQMNRGRLVQNYSAVTAACLVIRKAVYEQVGGFNEKDLAVAFNDVDFCLRVREAGYLNLWTPFAELVHHESASRGREDSPEKQARFAREVAYMRATWGAKLDSDPAYNPNLALSFEGWDLAWPPRAAELK